MATLDSLEQQIKELSTSMVAGFASTEKKLTDQIDLLANATKKEFDIVHAEIGDVKDRVDVVEQKVIRIERNLDTRMEMAQDHESRLGKLEIAVFPQN